MTTDRGNPFFPLLRGRRAKSDVSCISGSFFFNPGSRSGSSAGEGVPPDSDRAMQPQHAGKVGIPPRSPAEDIPHTADFETSACAGAGAIPHARYTPEERPLARPPFWHDASQYEPPPRMPMDPAERRDVAPCVTNAPVPPPSTSTSIVLPSASSPPPFDSGTSADDPRSPWGCVPYTMWERGSRVTFPPIGTILRTHGLQRK